VNVSFLASDLGKWDQLEGGAESAIDTLVLPFFADERPLRGAAGLCDWRLCGRLSRLLQTARVAGKWGEATLYPPTVAPGGARRLPFQRLLLVGLGAAERFDEKAAHEASRAIVEKMRRLGLSRYALVPPGRSTGRLSARRALEIYLDEVAAARQQDGGGDPGDLVVVESVAGQKEAAELTRSR
jgi:hypothetical protein